MFYSAKVELQEAEDAGFELGERAGELEGRIMERKKTLDECLTELRRVGHFHAAQILEQCITEEV